MPKLSLYIPDALWQQARAIDPALNQSQVAQRALQHWIAAMRSDRQPAVEPPAVEPQAVEPSAFEPPADAVPVLEGLVQKFANEAREQYQAAYRTAFELAERISWRSLDELASRGWDWAAWLRHGGRDIVKALPAWLREGDPGMPPTRRRNTTSIQGVIDGLRDIWESVQARPVHHRTPKAGGRRP